jgi:prevent-host-death family protein
MTDVTMTECRKHFGSFVRRAAAHHERITITDHGLPSAVLMSAEALADLEDQLALAQYDVRAARGEVKFIPHAEAREILLGALSASPQ